MAPEEKIEALREWLDEPIDHDADDQSFLDGMESAKRAVRDIVDPPKPKWRQMVDRESAKPLIGTPIGAVLYHLSHVANPSEYDDAFELANIIAVCEAQVGDGWQADPVRCFFRVEYSAWELLSRFSQNGGDAPHVSDWIDLADAAAHWLSDLTEGATASRHTYDAHCPVCFGECGGDDE